ncbi:MAG: hypothetical protein NVSMB58_22360 [Terriglobales bacterium]
MADSRDRNKAGTAIAAIVEISATTIRDSIRVNPVCLRDIEIRRRQKWGLVTCEQEATAVTGDVNKIARIDVIGSQSDLASQKAP